MSAGVPTVWLGLLQSRAGEQADASRTFNRTVIGGSACPPAMIRTFEDEYGVQVLHAWGMTEMSPLGTVCTLKSKHLARSKDEQLTVQAKQGRAIFGVDMKIVDDEGKDLPWDGKAFGDLLVRGPWITTQYFKGEGGNPLRDDERRGWFPTGDVATIDPDGYMQITDRSKDVIKSGGEWISSIDLENTAMAHPGGGGGGGDRRGAPEVGRAAAAGRGEEAGRAGHARGAARSSSRARSRSGGCPTTWCSSTSCRTPPPASC